MRRFAGPGPPAADASLAVVPVESSPEQPLPVRRVSQLLTQWIDRLGAIWVEGQVTQGTRRPGQATVFLMLRDPVADMSVTVTCRPLATARSA